MALKEKLLSLYNQYKQQTKNILQAVLAYLPYNLQKTLINKIKKRKNF
jgi:hypothetical protein